MLLTLLPTCAEYAIIKSKCSFPNRYKEWLNKLWAKLFLWGTFSLLWAVSVQQALGRQESRRVWEIPGTLWNEFCQSLVWVMRVNTPPCSHPELPNRRQGLKEACRAHVQTQSSSEVIHFRASRALSLRATVIHAWHSYSLTSCVTLGKLPHLSVSWLPLL